MKGTLGNFALVVCSLLFILLAAEGFLTYKAARLHSRLFERYENIGLCTKTHADPRLIYTIKPNQCGANSLGFIDDEHELVKPPATFRILVIGDSVAQGLGVARGSSFGMQLQTRLREVYAFPNVEVIVMARSGYSTSQELIVLADTGLGFDPDLIVWSYVLNDPAHPVFNHTSGDLGRYFFIPTSHTVHFLRRKVFELRERIARGECGSRFHLFLHCAYREQIEAHLTQLGRISKSSDIPILFVIHPFLEEFDEERERLAEVHGDLTVMARQAGMQVIDMLDVVRDENPDRIRQRPDQRDPWHPSTYGNSLIAKVLAETIVTDYLKSPAARLSETQKPGLTADEKER
ncbi:MAG: SGNH/GDSL hydrolase family protein [Gammaproteobacteria bacterium]|nr:SGNH/GDSL hydrolase family protein [Gammaproteobacteria bacterium]